MTTQILIEFDPKDASPLDTIHDLKTFLQNTRAENGISEFAIFLVCANDTCADNQILHAESDAEKTEETK